jgi:hypothetical protein
MECIAAVMFSPMSLTVDIISSWLASIRETKSASKDLELIVIVLRPDFHLGQNFLVGFHIGIHLCLVGVHNLFHVFLDGSYFIQQVCHYFLFCLHFRRMALLSFLREE